MMKVCQPHQKAKDESKMDNNKLAHATWNCKYHVAFAPKYRRKAIYGKLSADIGKILRELCERKDIEIIESELCPEPCTHVDKHTTKT